MTQTVAADLQQLAKDRLGLEGARLSDRNILPGRPAGAAAVRAASAAFS